MTLRLRLRIACIEYRTSDRIEVVVEQLLIEKMERNSYWTQKQFEASVAEQN
ncbi:hypothetical protein HanXRQr2_Chr14g0662931 [Helianthus annuus]|uniref:Uncharacterized protein n=1 Tax=Helianthus annuus TaxID=4232 RepID=A0A9K3EDZ2_HELAN|nr:hypothetical protein HanXRQr2_Chr14g0662931 [Helianthus annuus]KAJ0893319.1 hypothetical protein HanPSC8_Chr09g0376291 [Helianthus annuus]